MTDLWGTRDLMDEARLRPALGPVTGIEENAAAAWEDTWRSQMWISEDLAYDEEIAEVYERARQLGVKFKPANELGGPQYHIPETILGPIREEAARRSPDDKDFARLPKTEAELKAAIRSKAQAAAARNEDVYARSSTLGAVSNVGTNLVGTAIDPPNLITSLLGAPAAVGIVRGALMEAGINMVSEAVQQPQIQSYRAELGFKAGIPEAIERIGVAGAAGGGLYAGFRFAGLGIRGLTKLFRSSIDDPTPVQRAAADYLDRMEDIKDDNPFAPSAAETHQQRFDEAYAAVKAGLAPEVRGDVSAPPRIRDDLLGSTASARIATLADSGAEGLDWAALKAAAGIVDEALPDLRADQFRAAIPKLSRAGKPVQFTTREQAEAYIEKSGQPLEVRVTGGSVYVMRSSNLEVVRDEAGRPRFFDSEAEAQQSIKGEGYSVVAVPENQRLRPKSFADRIPAGRLRESARDISGSELSEWGREVSDSFSLEAKKAFIVVKNATAEDLKSIAAAPGLVRWGAEGKFPTQVPATFAPKSQLELAQRNAEQAKDIVANPQPYTNAVLAEAASIIEEQGDFLVPPPMSSMRKSSGDVGMGFGDEYSPDKPVSVKELLDDIADDEKLVVEFEKCLGQAAAS